jgi:1,4-dihydroxy-2-naphthoyl-CoA hydrolase
MIDLKWTAEQLQAAPAGFVHRRTAKFQDIDAAGIAFFPTIVEYLHDAYVEVLAAGGCSLPEALKANEWGAPIREVQARFLKPIRFGDALEVCVVKASCKGSDLAVGYRIQGQGGTPAIAVGFTTHVFVNRATFKRIEIPDQVRACFKQIEAA